mgnify:CR=1 FL=1
MRRYQITLNERTFDVRLLSDPRQEQVQVEVNGQTFTVEVKTLPLAGEMATALPDTVRPTATAAAPSADTITAPLPGVIKSITVQPGQRVAAGDELLVIEAMKMDNVICAQRRGTIGTVYVTEGRQVAYGELMLEYRA